MACFITCFLFYFVVKDKILESAVYRCWKEQNKVWLGHLQDLLTRYIYIHLTAHEILHFHICRKMQAIYFKRQLIPFEFWCFLLWMLKCRHFLTQVKLFSLNFFTWTGEHIPSKFHLGFCALQNITYKSRSHSLGSVFCAAISFVLYIFI